MKINLEICISIALFLLASCATREIEPGKSDEPASSARPSVKQFPQDTGETPPPRKKIKDGRQLELVRMMDGGVCKNDDQGAKGIFLLYANADDIARIKDEQGEAVFGDFETEIREFSLKAFQKAVMDTNIGYDPFALDTDDAQRKLTDKLINEFNTAVDGDMQEFERKTTLAIDIEPFRRSFVFYLNACEIADSKSAH